MNECLYRSKSACDTMDSVVIELNTSELEWCLESAEAIVAHYSKRGSKGSGTYNHNKVSSNLVGFKSEVGFKRWLHGFVNPDTVKCNFEEFLSPNGNGDVQVGAWIYNAPFDINFEVKGLRPKHWDDYKRCIPPNQLAKYVQNESIAIWAVATGDIENPVVELKGWNYCWEVSEFGEFRQTICANIWLKEDSKMRPMASLQSYILEAGGEPLEAN